jgi:23S rRNA pseudouridine1911/1915/1917 synthase
LKKSLEILFEDEYILAVNKPAGVLSIPDRYDKSKSNIHELLSLQLGQELFVLHRIDKDTSGVMLLAKNQDAHKIFSKLFESFKIHKTYFAILTGGPQSSEGSIKAPLAHDPTRPGKMKVHPRGKASQTDWKIIDRFQGFTSVEIDLKTGRTHQIRVHMSHIGHPLAVDSFYGKKEALNISDIKPKARHGKTDEKFPDLINRCSLHSWKIMFIHPVSNHQVLIEAPLPKDLQAVINQLRKNNR